jgi:peptide/nickel transport system substrate-binding protein
MTLVRYATATVGVTALVASLAACTPGPSGETPTGTAAPAQTLRIGLADDVQSWDTMTANLGSSLQAFQAPYDTLIRQLPKGDLAPMLATDWQYDESKTKLTLNLVSDVTFSDGEKFDAEAVGANIEHFRTGKGPQTTQLAAVKSVDVADEDTVVVNLSEPDPALLNYFSGAAGLMASPAAIKAGTLAQTPVGTGPYVMDTSSTVAGSQYVFTAREDYWAPDLQRFPGVEYIYLDDTARVNSLVSGQIHSAAVESGAVPQIEGAGRAVLKNASAADWEGMIIFDRDGQLVPALGDVRVRQAMNHAIDEDALSKALSGGASDVTNQIFGPGSGAYVKELNETYPYDPERAKKLLAEAGYPDGFEMTVPSPSFLSDSWAIVGQYLSDVGITVKPEAIPFEKFRGDIAAQKYPVGMFRFNAGDPWGTSIRNYISTRGSVWNPFKTQSPELDALLLEVQNAGEQYGEAAQAVNKYVVEEAWFVPYFFSAALIGYDSETIEVVEQVGSPIPYLYNFSPAS